MATGYRLMPSYDDRFSMCQATINAIEAGYRHIDTAFIYLTEDIVGKAIANVTRRGIVKRKDLYISTKLPYSVVNRAGVVPAVKNALKRLQLDYVDLCLIHQPVDMVGSKDYDNLEIWRGLEDAKRLCLTRSIGLSNFNSTFMTRILANSDTVPAVNQLETNPTYANLETVAYCQSLNIVVTGYAPFGFLVPRTLNDLSLPPTFDDPFLVGLARKYAVNVSQIVLRYPVERGIIPIAKSSNIDHIKQNVDIFGFTIDPEDILRINQFDRNVKVYRIDYPGLFQFVRDNYPFVRRYVRRNNLRQYIDDL
ncbi:aldo-keto reductase AKR2E4-like [Bicyclus anynana]|uniref:Aldo-keto reductase AKR2E4-like n=1 Tax=Bicyclus anynana TaxID=110368 RepID=A0A6J1NH28_BICAN|nr:aldo-keto reductase AKR2E4-like [Bicyclus anynana]